MMLAPIDTADKVYSITPSGMSVGAVSSIPGFRLGAGVTLGVRNETAFGTTAKIFGFNSGYLGAGNFVEPLYETIAAGRDVVVQTWSRIGWIYLRCNKKTGRAIQIGWTGQVANGEMSIRYVSSAPANTANYVSPGDLGEIILFQTYNLASYLTGWNTSSTAGDQFEFSFIGQTLTVKWNGQTIYTANDLWFCGADGTVIYAPGIAEGAIRDTTITFKPSAVTYTDFDNNVLDPRDWGWKDLRTTGSMGPNSNSLIVASAAGFSVGDPIVVELGGEAGAGLVGTIGVGGTWPATRVANFAALPDATTYRAANAEGDCFIWVTAENSVYINYLNNGVATWAEWTNYVRADAVRSRGLYHTTNLRPRALKAKITAISGTTLTLDKSSDAATTSAVVYYDCSDILPNKLAARFMNASIGFSQTKVPWTIKYPPGKFCVTKALTFTTADNWAMTGASRSSTVLYSPKGAQQAQIVWSGSHMQITKFTIQSWAGIDYWCPETANGYMNQIQNAVILGYPYNSYCLIEDVDTINTWGGPQLVNKFYSKIRNCHATHNNGNNQQYATWYYQMAYCTDSWIENCEYNADKVNSAFEIFQCTGGGFRNIRSVQGYVASNTSGGGFVMDNMDISVDFRYTPTANAWIVENNPVVNINSNIVSSGGAEDPSLAGSGGTIRNPKIKIHSSPTYIQGAAIAIQADCSHVVVEGTHPSKPGSGYIEMSGYTGLGGYDERGAVGIISDADFTTVRGMRVVGLAQGDNFANINLRKTNGSIQNCVADDITQWNGTTTASKMGVNGNITNAQYEALP